MGSIQKRGDSFLLTVSVGKGLGGTRRRFTKTVPAVGRTEEKQWENAQKELAIFEDEVKKGLAKEGDKLTFKEFVDIWIRDYADPQLKKLEIKTFHRYKEMLDTRIIPAIGHIRLCDMLQTPTILHEFYNNLRETGIRLDYKYALKSDVSLDTTITELSKKAKINDRTAKKVLNHLTVTKEVAEKVASAAKCKLEDIFEVQHTKDKLDERTIWHHHRLISSILGKAVKWNMLRDNPARFVDPPSPEKKEAKSYNAEQARRLIQALEYAPLKYKVIVLLTVHTGVREGELTGLEWSDIDFRNNIISIRRASQYLPGKGTFTKDTLKTESSKRMFYVPDYVMDLLRVYRKWQLEQEILLKNKWVKSNRLFTQENGLPMHPYTPTKWLPKFIERYNNMIMNDDKIKDKEEYLLPPINFHGLRHTNLSLLLKAGLDIGTVSKWAGHSRKSTTLDIYIHDTEVIDTRPAEALEKIFGYASTKNIKRFRLKRI